MTETKLISIRVPADLLAKIDAAAQGTKPLTRSGIIVNYLNAVFDAADADTRFILATWAIRKQKQWKITAVFDPYKPSAGKLNSSNLITP